MVSAQSFAWFEHKAEDALLASALIMFCLSAIKRDD